jgi:two-component system cell cycle response regulator
MGPMRGVSILLIEDNEDVRELTAFLLERLGARVTMAANGAEGHAKLLAECPDLTLCDLVMPVMDGIEFARRARRTPGRAHVLLVALTSRRDDNSYLSARAAGFDAYVEKPITPEKMAGLVRRFLPPAPPAGDPDSG